LKLDGQLLRLLLLTATASGAMALVSWVSLRLLQPRFDSGNILLRMAVLLIVLSLSAGTFLAIARLLKLSQARQIMSTVWDLLPGAANRDRR
jgi:hypothetical protein